MSNASGSRDTAVRLLLLLSRTDFSDDEKLVAGDLCRSLSDWQSFTDLATRHGVAALVWQNISDLGMADLVPQPERTTMEALRLKTIARVSFITASAVEIVTLLENEGIKALIIKGLALEHTVYGSRGLRQMSDADLLILPEDILRARDLLTRAGFFSDPMKSSLYRHIILDIGNHLPELNRSGMSVDLHHRLFGPEGTEMVRRAAEKPEMVSAGGKVLYVLPPQTAFLGLVSHIFKHGIKGEFQLRLYADVYLLARKYYNTIFSDDFTSKVLEAGIAAEVRTVLHILDRAYGLAVPAGFGVLTEAGKKTAGEFSTVIAYPEKIKPRSQKSIFLENLRSLKGFRRKFIFIIGDLFPSVHFMKSRYGCKSCPGAILYYPHRLGKLIWIFEALFSRSGIK